jgi:hypothetical protein
LQDISADLGCIVCNMDCFADFDYIAADCCNVAVDWYFVAAESDYIAVCYNRFGGDFVRSLGEGTDIPVFADLLQVQTAESAPAGVR